MPVEDPQSGEVWTTTDIGSGRLMQGIVADVAPTRVLFVSLSGNRVAVPLSRLRTSWHFVQGAPRRTLPPCERAGCTSAGMIEYDRGSRAIRTCPKHTPYGIQCRITQNYTAPLEPRNIRPGFECRSTPCPNCGSQDPAEDVRIAVYPARLWFCPSCNGRWVTVPRVTDVDDQGIEQLATMIGEELRRLQYDVDSMLVLDPMTFENLSNSPRVASEPATEAVRRLTIGNMQAFLDIGAITSEVRDFFVALVRVRRDTVRQADRPVHRLGGSPNRGGVVGSTANPVRPVPAPPAEPMLYRPTGVPEAAAHAATLHRLRQEERSARDLFESPESIETPVPDIPIDRESLWVQRMTGDVMVVLDVIKAADGSDAISFRRRSAEEIEPAVTMIRRDFLIHHKPYITSSEARQTLPMIPVAVDEEWECSDGSGMVITNVDHRKEVVFGDDVKTKKHRQIPFVQFATGRWRKIVRRSVYDRIRQPEINLSSSSSEDE